jgi:hypothetical protein
MYSGDVEKEIESLKIMLSHYEQLLRDVIQNDEILAITKTIYNDMKSIELRLMDLQQLNKQRSPSL